MRVSFFGGLVASSFSIAVTAVAMEGCHASTSTDAPTDDGGADSGCTFTGDPEPAMAEPPRHTPRWAFEPWISKDISSTDDSYDFVNGFVSRGIPVGTVVLDSPWETNYNTFVPNPARYHDFAKLVSDMHAQGVRVVVWTTQMVNTSSFDTEPGGDSYDSPASNFDQGQACGFFVNSGDTYFWWKGRGSGVDFTNARATAWWHRQQDPVLAMGIDGYKLDFGENYINVEPLVTSAGPITRQAYSEAYYRDFLAYGVAQRGADFTTMVRGWDVSYGFDARFYAKKEDAPVVWAGDNRRDFVGVADALNTIFHSAQAGYVMVGSDIGGYLGFDDKDVSTKIPFSTEVFARWTAFGALTPFMQLHGQANATPWTVPDHVDLIVDVYKTYATLHHELVPFLYSLAEEAYAGGQGILRPIGDETAWAGDFRFTLGDALLVAPIVTTGGTRDVALPAGSRWYDWWNPSAAPVDGGTTVKAYDATDWHRVPLFVRQGAILPMSVASDVTGIGNAASSGLLTLLVYPAAAPEHFVLHDEDGATTAIDAQNEVGTGATIALSRATKATLLRVRADTPPTAALHDGAALATRATRDALDAADSGWFVDVATKSVWVKIPASPNAKTNVTLTGP